MCNAFNLVSRQAILDECALHFPELLLIPCYAWYPIWVTWCYALLWYPIWVTWCYALLWYPIWVTWCYALLWYSIWVTWCYALLWYPMGHISSEAGVQQGDLLGPLLFALVLQKIINAIDADDGCVHILYQTWYLGNGT